MQKRVVETILVIGMIVGLMGCGNTTSKIETSPNLSQIESVTKSNIDSSIVENISNEIVTGADETGIYPESTGCAEITVGDTEAICNVSVPLNYLFSGNYYKNGVDTNIPEINTGTTVEEARENGVFTQYIIYSFVMTALNQDNTNINMVLLNSEMISFDEIKTRVDNIMEIGDTVPGYAYYFEESGRKGLKVGIKVSEKYTLEFDYFGDNVEKMTEEELAQKIYDLVTIK